MNIFCRIFGHWYIITPIGFADLDKFRKTCKRCGNKQKIGVVKVKESLAHAWVDDISPEERRDKKLDQLLK